MSALTFYTVRVYLDRWEARCRFEDEAGAPMAASAAGHTEEEALRALLRWLGVMARRDGGAVYFPRGARSRLFPDGPPNA
jgi:hypothetical protein